MQQEPAGLGLRSSQLLNFEVIIMINLVENQNNGFDLIENDTPTGQTIFVENLFDEEQQIMAPTIVVSNTPFQLAYYYSINKKYVVKDVNIILKYLNIQISPQQFNNVVEKLYSQLLNLKSNPKKVNI